MTRLFLEGIQPGSRVWVGGDAMGSPPLFDGIMYVSTLEIDVETGELLVVRCFHPQHTFVSFPITCIGEEVHHQIEQSVVPLIERDAGYVLYASGDEFTDGSVRMRMVGGRTEAEVRVNGAWVAQDLDLADPYVGEVAVDPGFEAGRSVHNLIWDSGNNVPPRVEEMKIVPNTLPVPTGKRDIRL